MFTKNVNFSLTLVYRTYFCNTSTKGGVVTTPPRCSKRPIMILEVLEDRYWYGYGSSLSIDTKKVPLTPQ